MENKKVFKNILKFKPWKWRWKVGRAGPNVLSLPHCYFSLTSYPTPSQCKIKLPCLSCATWDLHFWRPGFNVNHSCAPSLSPNFSCPCLAKFVKCQSYPLTQALLELSVTLFHPSPILGISPFPPKLGYALKKMSLKYFSSAFPGVLLQEAFQLPVSRIASYIEIGHSPLVFKSRED